MGLFDSLFGQKEKAPPTLQQYSAPKLSDIFNKFTDQGQQLTQLQDFTTNVNKAFQNVLTSTDPQLMQNVNQFANNTSAMLQGQLPADVANRVSRSSAFQAIQGGFGGGSQMGRGLEARDFGRTSLDLMQAGGQMQTQQMRNAMALNPMQVQEQLFTPQQLFQTDMALNQANTDLANQQNMMQWDSANRNRKQGILGTLGTIGGGIAGGILGGPMGASMGMAAGGALGSAGQSMGGGNSNYLGQAGLQGIAGLIGGSVGTDNSWGGIFGVPQAPNKGSTQFRNTLPVNQRY